ncbi:MAG: PorP/SprF family type IX secretion system membrane protein [Paludibacter sp.]|nr:PorP/SprF family type IX secretion system membrane protein [Paludibacter sp.]
MNLINKNIHNSIHFTILTSRRAVYEFIMKKSFMICFIVFFLSAISNQIFSQADISMVTHWNNRANYNPASIARQGYVYLFSNIRNQWTGIAGSPQVINVQASGFSENLNSGFGISLVADKIGLTQVLNPMLSYAFRIVDKNENAFAMGVSAGVFGRGLNGTGYNPEDLSDPFLNYMDVNSIRPDANVGFEFQSRYFVAGLSTTHLFSIGNDSLFLNSNHRYGYLIFKNTDSELFNYHFGVQCVNRSSIFIVEGNAGIRYKHPTGLSKGAREIFDVGITYRSTKQLSLLFGIMLTSDLRAGYAFDKSFIAGYQANSTHEIMLEYRIPVKELNCKTCRNSDFWYH